MLAPVDWANTKLIVEYGPGVGTFTRPILDRLAPDATLVAIDTNRDFCDYLKRTITDSRLQIVNGSAADVRQIVADLGFEQADYAISGLPFSTLPPGVGPEIARRRRRCSSPAAPSSSISSARACANIIEPHFDRVDHAFEPINVPPAQLWWFRKD